MKREYTVEVNVLNEKQSSYNESPDNTQYK